jgi:5-methylcytosine-specific restriction enzyme subunit McrC
LLDAADRSKNYGLSQSDFYQLFAYGQKYLKGCGELVLIYPAWAKFDSDKSISDFQFDAQLSLRVLPFDLEDSCAAQNLIDQLSMPAHDVLVNAA